MVLGSVCILYRFTTSCEIHIEYHSVSLDLRPNRHQCGLLPGEEGSGDSCHICTFSPAGICEEPPIHVITGHLECA